MKKIVPEVPDCLHCSKRHDSLFCNLSDEELAHISQNKTAQYYRKSEVIFYEGHRCTGLYAVYRGKVKIHKIGDEGKEQILRFADEGELLGYRALLAGGTYNATATAMEDSVVCRISKERFLQVLAGNNQLSLQTIKMLANNLKTSEDTIVNITQKTALERIAESLLILKKKFGLKSDENTLDVALSRKEIGQLAGITTETTIRTLSELNKSGLIELSNKSIVLKDLPKLLRLANVSD